MSGLIRGIGKVVKKVVSGVKKVFKKITSSKLGKALLLTSAVFLGGAALGLWGSPFASINGVLTKAGSQASQAAASAGIATDSATALTAGSTVAPGVAAPTGETIASNAIPSVAGGTGPTLTSNAVSTVAPGSGVLAPAATTSTREGILNRLLSGAVKTVKSVAGYADKHPYASAMMLNAAASALTPDQLDLQNEQYKREDSERERREKNLNIAGISLGMNAASQPLRTTDGNPVRKNGFLNTDKLN